VVYRSDVVDDPDILRAHLDRLIELARRAQPEDRARLERSIELVSRAHQEVARARQAAERACRLREEADANLVHQQSDLIALLAELRIMNDRIPK
jgi:hypothetical protein